MKYVVIIEKQSKIHKYDGQEDGIKAIEQLKFLTETFDQEIKEGAVKIYMIME